MTRSLLIGCFGFIIAVVAVPLGRLIGGNWKDGLISGLIALILTMIASLVSLLRIKEISWFDVFLPIPVALVWSMILAPFSLGSAIFTAPALIGSSLMLTLSLWMVKHNRMNRAWLIFPAIVFIYEMLPVNIPGPFDDYFSFGGDVTCLLIQGTRSLMLSKANNIPSI